MQSCLPASTYVSTHVHVHPYTHKPRGGRKRRREREEEERGAGWEEGEGDRGGEKRVLSRHRNPLSSLMTGFQSLKSIRCAVKTVLATHMHTHACTPPPHTHTTSMHTHTLTYTHICPLVPLLTFSHKPSKSNTVHCSRQLM